jgi:hypothetical protein
MTEEKSIPWIFLSIAVASQVHPADFRGITMIADGINHAIPTHKELQTAISWLTKKELILKRSNKYELSEKGKREFENVSNKNMGYLKMWEILKLNLKKL